MHFNMVRLVFLCCIITLCNSNKSNGLKLEQVLVLSRHNIRTPLTTNLEAYSPKTWPKFTDPDAALTQKGTLMEHHMAEFFAEWLAAKDLIKGCPKPEEVHVYSNTLPRTIDTAKSFAEAAFRSCNISVHHYKDIKIFDPMFLSILHNNSDNFVQEVIKEMEKTLIETDLKESYRELNKILDLENSEICKQKNLCDLSINETSIFYEEGEEPNVKGPLAIGTQVVDAFIMSYYEGFPLENVAWGKITTEEQWEVLSGIIKHNQRVRFHSIAAQDIGKPLFKYMLNIFRSENPKFTILVGHDSNFCVTLRALNFKEFVTKDQYEPFPIGGKLVFQKWSRGPESFLKVEYVYPTFSQLRKGDKFSLAQPPQTIVLELKDCKIDDRGFCPWDDFVKFFISLAN